MKRLRPAPSIVLLRWTFRRGSDFLTCRLDRRSDAYALRVIPHDDRRQSSLETIETAAVAVQRHGYTAAQLREMGWTLVDYTRPARKLPAVETAAA